MLTNRRTAYNSTSTTSLVNLLRLIYDSGIFGVNGVIAMNSTDTGHESFLTDGRGSVTEMITGSGNITTYSYDAFGNVRTSGDSNNPFTYNQERFDFGVGLQYLRARYVDLSLGRFVSRDSVLGTLEDPRTHNLFLYVQNDPMNFIDPSGHIAQAGGGGSNRNQIPGQLCPARCAWGLNIPSARTTCSGCGRTRPACLVCNSGRNLVPGRACRVCNRTIFRTSIPPRVGPLPSPGGSNRNNTINQANGAGHQQNSRDIPTTPPSSAFEIRVLETLAYTVRIFNRSSLTWRFGSIESSNFQLFTRSISDISRYALEIRYGIRVPPRYGEDTFLYLMRNYVGVSMTFSANVLYTFIITWRMPTTSVRLPGSLTTTLRRDNQSISITGFVTVPVFSPAQYMVTRARIQTNERAWNDADWRALALHQALTRR